MAAKLTPAFRWIPLRGVLYVLLLSLSIQGEFGLRLKRKLEFTLWSGRRADH